MDGGYVRHGQSGRTASKGGYRGDEPAGQCIDVSCAEPGADCVVVGNAVVLNVGRGTAIDTDALADARYAGKIAGAALDVTDPEPLPADHQLWNAPNLLITPHVSGGFSLPETLEKIVGLFADNLERYFAGQPIENLVNLQTGYRE